MSFLHFSYLVIFDWKMDILNITFLRAEFCYHYLKSVEFYSGCSEISSILSKPICTRFKEGSVTVFTLGLASVSLFLRYGLLEVSTKYSGCLMRFLPLGWPEPEHLPALFEPGELFGLQLPSNYSVSDVLAQPHGDS